MSSDSEFRRHRDPMPFYVGGAVGVLGAFVRWSRPTLAPYLLLAGIVLLVSVGDLLRGHERKAWIGTVGFVLAWLGLAGVWPTTTACVRRSPEQLCTFQIETPAIILGAVLMFGTWAIGARIVLPRIAPKRAERTIARRDAAAADESFPRWARKMELPEGSTLLGDSTTPTGTRRTVRLAERIGFYSTDRARELYARILHRGLDRAEVYYDPNDRSLVHFEQIVETAFDRADQHGAEVPPPPLARNRLHVGYDRATRVISLRLDIVWHTLIGGASGFGKSSLMRALAGQLIGNGNVIIWWCDPHANRKTRRMVGADRFEGASRGGAAMLIDVVAEMRRRQDLMAESDADVYDGPALAVVIDELSSVLRHRGAKAALAEVLEEGRKFGIGVVGGMQSPKANLLGEPGQGTAVRGQFANRICLHVADARESNAVLGDGMASRGFDASKLCRRPGDALVWRPGDDTPTLVRCWTRVDGRSGTADETTLYDQGERERPSDRPAVQPAIETTGEVVAFHGERDGETTGVEPLLDDVLVLDALGQHGPQTARQLAERLTMTRYAVGKAIARLLAVEAIEHIGKHDGYRLREQQHGAD